MNKTLFDRKTAFQKAGNTVNLPTADANAFEKSGLDWTVSCRPLFCADSDGNPSIMPEHRAIIRSDNNRPLGVVGLQYTPFQNADLFGFFQKVCDPDTTIETAGSFNGGKTVWAQARIPSLNLTIGQDVTHGSLLITNSHDGGGSLRIMPTTTRVICKNTLNLAIRTAKKSDTIQRVRHSDGIASRVSGIANDYLSAIAQWHGAAESYRSLATRGASKSTFLDIISAAWEVTADHIGQESSRAQTIRKNRERMLAQLRASETCNVPGTSGTIFSDLQAVTEYVDHFASDDASYSLTGAGADVKQRALTFALSLV